MKDDYAKDYAAEIILELQNAAPKPERAIRKNRTSPHSAAAISSSNEKAHKGLNENDKQQIQYEAAALATLQPL